MPIPLLVIIELAAEARSRLEAAGFEVDNEPDPRRRAGLIRETGARVRAVLTNGSTGITAEEIAALPNLEMICALGAGYERIDLAAARARGLVVTHGPGANAACVADHAMALLLAAARGIATADAAVRCGGWAESRQLRPMISGKKLGILGLGTIGERIARRGGGFDMQVAYHNRKAREGTEWLYLPSVTALAAWSDFLVVATPGGAATAHLVDEGVLDALGPGSFLVNVARGSVVDTRALIAALQQGRIAGAALDVVEGEPDVPPELIALDNVVLTPHIAGRAPEAVQATLGLVIDNLQAHFSGQPVLTPVP
ncbi:2-hydroxyacid dehydrogenase [Ancylobacter defluvii]|uniref:2-hydroxyacid dehydrogenase n=1 Tax=Ancylobacter defluvii TaxID=1282440 RepID=A0A9W6JZM0_9HYPH|nr:2-hydroxyacid dehydrogenase [Ancylobacter defluvii]MBS7588400.1 2-hydroxyacid dehydrogenase [Ancylobacter defluvii]GLK86805.1 2-hydroxyacid dehydrogenase [Ancylobacter defluvii]